MGTVKATIENGELVLRIPANVDNPPESKSGKTLVIASSRGNQSTGLEVKGRVVVVGLNAYIPNE